MPVSRIKLNCDKCGSPVPIPTEAADRDMIICDNCGAELATVGQLKAEITRQAGERVKKKLRSVKGFKPN